MQKCNLEKAIKALTTADIDVKKVELLNYLEELDSSIQCINSECETLWDVIVGMGALICEKRES